MAQTETGRIIVKGNVYFLGTCKAYSDNCNFDPLQPEQLLAVNHYTLPSSAVNIISGSEFGSPSAHLDAIPLYASRYNAKEDEVLPALAHLSAEDLYSTGKIYTLYPARTRYGQEDTRQPAQGSYDNGYIDGDLQRDANLPS